MQTTYFWLFCCICPHLEFIKDESAIENNKTLYIKKKKIKWRQINDESATKYNKLFFKYI